MAREAVLTIAIGRKGVGKTYKTLEMISNYLKRNRKKVLILDVNNEFANVKKDQNPNFPHVKALNINHLSHWVNNDPAIEARRISVLRPVSEGGGKMSTGELVDVLSQILDEFKNGLLLIEDINKIVSDSIGNELMGAIVTQRHSAVDIVTHFQSVGKMLHPKLWANANWIRFHKCDDTVKKHKNKLTGTEDYLYIAEAIVKNEYEAGNKRFCLYIDKDDTRLRGEYTLQMFDKGVERFLEENYNIVKAEADKRDIRTGEKIYKNQSEAVQKIMTEYRDQYFQA